MASESACDLSRTIQVLLLCLGPESSDASSTTMPVCWCIDGRDDTVHAIRRKPLITSQMAAAEGDDCQLVPPERRKHQPQGHHTDQKVTLSDTDAAAGNDAQLKAAEGYLNK